jgi:hypothetical protein
VPSRRRHARSLALALAAAAALLAVLVPTASASDNGHAFSFSFKGSGTNELSNFVRDIAIRQSNGDVYVLDQNNHRVDVFDEAGNFKFMFGKEVNATTHGFTCTSVETCQAGKTGALPEAFGEVTSIAIDQVTGAVYVAGSVCCTTYSIAKYDGEGHLETGWQSGGVTTGTTSPTGQFAFVSAIDTDGAGDLLVMADTSPARIVKYNPAGTTITEIPVSGSVTGVFNSMAWSPQGFDYYANGEYERWNLRRINAADGTGLVDFGQFWFEGGRFIEHIAVDGSDGDVYALTEVRNSGNEHSVVEYQVDASGQPKQANGSLCSKVLSAGSSGCSPTNEFGRAGFTLGTLGSQGSLDVNSTTHAVYTSTTLPKVGGGSISRINVYAKAKAPVAETFSPTGNKTMAGKAKLDGASEIVKCQFEFGTTQEYGSSVPCSPATPYAGEQAVTAEITGANEQTYHYRLAITNAEGGTALGQDKTITPHNVVGVETLPVEEVTRTSAKLRGSFQGDGTPTEYWFKWGLTNAYGHETAPIPVSPTPTYPPATEVSVTAPSLEAQKTYHFQVVFKNATGTTLGADTTFVTANAVKGLSTQAPVEVLRRKGTIKGTFETDNTEGEGSTEYWFEWAKGSTLYNHSTPVQTTSTPGTHPFEVALTGCGSNGVEPDSLGCLDLETTYHYRLVAKNSLGETKGADQQFTTKPAVAGVKTLAATDISQASVTLNGEFEGNGEETEYFFEYGPTTKYAKTTVPVEPGSPNGATPAITTITEFEGNTLYHYRLVAVNPVGQTLGPDETFETEDPQLPGVGGTEATEVGPTTATLSGEVNPNRWATVYSFEYGPTTSYGSSTILKEVLDGNLNTDIPVSAGLLGLAPGTTYHFRIVAVNLAGTSKSADGTFTTPDVPLFETSEVSGVTATGAHLATTVVPNSSPTTVHFEYGTGPGLGQSTGGTGIGGDTLAHSIGADLSGLQPATTYHYRVVATNEVGSAATSQGTFTTLAAPGGPSGGETPPPKCRRGFVRRSGKCVKRHHHRRHKHRHNAHRSARHG